METGIVRYLISQSANVLSQLQKIALDHASRWVIIKEKFKGTLKKKKSQVKNTAKQVVKVLCFGKGKAFHEWQL